MLYQDAPRVSTLQSHALHQLTVLNQGGLQLHTIQFHKLYLLKVCLSTCISALGTLQSRTPRLLIVLYKRVSGPRKLLYLLHQAKSFFFLAVTYTPFKNIGSSNVEQGTADLYPPESRPYAISPLLLVHSSAHSRSTVSSTEVQYLHPFIDAEAEKASSDNSSDADTEDNNMPEIEGVRNYVTNEYCSISTKPEECSRKSQFSPPEAGKKILLSRGRLVAEVRSRTI